MDKLALPKNKGNALLYHSITHSNVRDIIRLLEDKEADVNAQNINGATPLHFAVHCDNPTIVEILLKFKADPNIHEYFDVGECTPLHRAVERNQFTICQMLLEAGANPSAKSKLGFTALHYAARYGYKDIAYLLIASGVDIHARDKEGCNASYWAKLSNFENMLDILPPVAYITPDALYEFNKQVREIHEIQLKFPAKKKGGKKKKKK